MKNENYIEATKRNRAKLVHVVLILLVIFLARLLSVRAMLWPTPLLAHFAISFKDFLKAILFLLIWLT